MIIDLEHSAKLVEDKLTGVSSIDEVTTNAAQIILTLAPDKDRTNTIDETFEPATNLLNIQEALNAIGFTFAKEVSPYLSSNSDNDNAKKINYWFQQIGPVLKTTTDQIKKAGNGFCNQSMILEDFVSVQEKPKILTEQGMTRYAAEHWDHYVADGTTSTIKISLDKRKGKEPKLADLANRDAIYQQRFFEWSEQKNCLDRGLEDVSSHCHASDLKLTPPTQKNSMYELMDTELAHLRDAAYVAAPHGSLILAQYDNACTNGAVNGTTQSERQAAGIGSSLVADRMFALSGFFGTLSGGLTDQAKAAKTGLMKISHYMAAMGTYMTASLDAMGPVIKSVPFGE